MKMSVSRPGIMVYNGGMQNGEPTFELNDTILERIIFAMEDQTKSRVIDLRTGELVPKPEGDLPLYLAPPPIWAPADGFKLMENFCARLKNLELKRALLRALSHGKGVFKAFRQVLTEFPQEELQFREYKNAVLRRFIESWLDDMRESLGLSRLGPEPEEYGELLDEEFSVERLTLVDLPFELAPLVESACREALAWLPAAAAFLEKADVLEFLENHAANGFLYIVPEAGGKPIAAAAGAVVRAEGRPISIVRFLYVARDFRELNLEFRLLDNIHDWSRQNSMEQVIVRSLFMRPALADQMAARGMKTLGSHYLIG